MSIGELLFLVYALVGLAVGFSWPVWLYFLFT